MANRSTYSAAKRRKELDRKKKQEEKRAARLQKATAAEQDAEPKPGPNSGNEEPA